SSTLDKGINNEYFLNVTKNGTLEIIKKNNNIFIQNVCLYHHIWQIRIILNNPKTISKLNKDEIKIYKQNLNELFKHIKVTTIEKFNIAGCDFYYKIGMLNCFKKEDSNFNICYIKKICNYKNEILLSFFTRNKNWNLKVEFDNGNYEIISKKTIEHKFIDEIFIYENYVWIKYSFLANNFKLYLDNKEMMIGYGNYIYDLNKISSNNSNIWVFIDSDMRADDNAEHLYRYVMKNHLDKKICFVLDKKSKDWERLKEEGFNLVEFKSHTYYKIAKETQVLISSHADRYFLNDFDLFSKTKFVFLQHGITKDNLSNWLNGKTIDLLITATKAEYNSITNENYKFSHKETRLTGFARHDNLIHLVKHTNSTNTIILMPTWRQYLVTNKNNTSERNKINDIIDSNYFKTYKSFLMNQKVLDILKAHNYKIKVLLHQAMSVYKDEYQKLTSQYVNFYNLSDISLQEELITSKALITDYSSIAFEMALINKPVIYYQFDKDEFFANHTYAQGYFEYERDGFGAVVETEGSLIKELENLFKLDFNIEQKYQERINNTFVFKDSKNCERIYQEIIKL
ncbi:CDP-glycerol glycerophosphotransferase family protein, partial [Campylobacter sp. RM9333]|nr:CDP-glycerol glycerophosphotransferase family protein [Campylobacter sp. RM9333]